MDSAALSPKVRQALMAGQVIPAHPLALDSNRKLDERRQRALTRYYLAAGAGGIAVGVHTTQFAIHKPEIGLLKPVLELASETVDRFHPPSAAPIIKIAGIVGETSRAVAEARLARDLGYHIGLVSLAGLKASATAQLVDHLKAVAEVLPIMGFYLQPAVGGRRLEYRFWREVMEIDNMVAIKIAPFGRYETLDVIRAVHDSGRAQDVALYTGNDDHIVLDLLSRYRFEQGKGGYTILRMVGGLLGHWAFWTRRAVELLDRIQKLHQADHPIPPTWLELANQITDANAAVFDAAHQFAGCIPGIHEILRRQGLLAGCWTLNADETLSPGQMEAIDRIYRLYPHLNDDAFVREHIDEWLR